MIKTDYTRQSTKKRNSEHRKPIPFSEYERQKRELSPNLTPNEYTKACQEIAQRLGL